MKFEINNTTLGIIIFVLFIVLICSSNKNENWTHVNGASQEWININRDKLRCDTGFNDEKCKYNAVNCLNNQGSLMYNNDL
jgi:hypothetical protein